MGDTIEQVIRQLRALAVELVRNGRASEAAAVLAGIGAVELLSTFAEGSQSTGNGQQQPEHQEHFG